MHAFAALYAALDRSTSLNAKRAALTDYFDRAPPHDAAWALHVLTGRKLARIANTRELREWMAQESGHPGWLVDDCYAHVGDLAETLTLLLDDPPEERRIALPLSQWIEQRLLPVAGRDAALRREAVVAGWHGLACDERLVFNKLLTGSLRVGASQKLVQQALAQASGVDIARIAQRMLGDWTPSPGLLARLLSDAETAEDRGQPYPFYLASPLEQDAAILGDIREWQLEWKWDGIRAQLIRRAGEVALWSRGEERLDGRFPEIETAARPLPDGVVLDGEIVCWRDGAVLPFAKLQPRINRRKPGPKLMADCPAVFLAFDLLEQGDDDLREFSMHERRARLERLVRGLASSGAVDASALRSGAEPVPAFPRGQDEGQAPQDAELAIRVSPLVEAASWDAAAALRAQSRERGVEGLMLKRLDSPYRIGRRRGDWWKWKIDPLTIDAVLVYAQAGHGRRSTLFTDYTFALWDGDALVPVAKAYSGLDDAEILKLDRWIRANTLERFGPVRSVKPEHVFELAFEAVNASTRHKSGVAVRFPRILRWRTDKRIADADRLETLQALAR